MRTLIAAFAALAVLAAPAASQSTAGFPGTIGSRRDRRFRQWKNWQRRRSELGPAKKKAKVRRRWLRARSSRNGIGEKVPGKLMPIRRPNGAEETVRELNEFLDTFELRGGTHRGYIRVFNNGEFNTQRMRKDLGRAPVPPLKSPGNRLVAESFT
jgi:hypothetical protein